MTEATQTARTDVPGSLEARAPCEARARDAPAEPGGASLDGRMLDELTHRLPASELVKIIKNALECGRRNLPFTESQLLRAIAFGSSVGPAPGVGSERRR